MDYNTWRLEEEKIASVNREAHAQILCNRGALIGSTYSIFTISALTIAAFKTLSLWLICMVILLITLHLIGLAVFVYDLVKAKKIYRDGIKAMNEFYEKYAMPNPEE